MGLLYRCTSCEKEMVLESFHRGRTVRCPHCRRQNDVPDSLDFRRVSRETLQDSNKGGWLLPLAIASSALCCLPVVAWAWWHAGGIIHRAKDEEREVEPTVLWARWVAIAGSVVALIAWGLAGYNTVN